MRIFLFILVVILGFSFVGKRRQTVFTCKAPKPVGPYSQGIIQGNLLYVSGQIAWKPDGTPDTSSIENETRQVMENISAIVEAGNLKMTDISKVTIFCTDLRNFSRINEVYKTYFPNDPPARETIEVRGLPKGAHIEISAIAGE